jgi:hypothetical protein
MKDEETVAHLLACGADVNAHTQYGHMAHIDDTGHGLQNSARLMVMPSL